MTVLCDLDGVIYRGARALPGVAEAMRRLIDSSVPTFFITNNSTRTPTAAAEKISEVTGVVVDGSQVLTSGLAAMTMIGSDSPVLVVGEDGLRQAVTDAGHSLTDDPTEAKSVVVGLTRSLSYEMITTAMHAIRGGARFIATNDDTTFPTELGLAPGCGAIVAAIAAAAGAAPEVAGKPNVPMRDLIRSRVYGDAWVIGDRIDTDMALASGEPGWRSILVLTGITEQLMVRDGDADFVVDDFPAAVDLVLGTSQQS